MRAISVYALAVLVAMVAVPLLNHAPAHTTPTSDQRVVVEGGGVTDPSTTHQVTLSATDNATASKLNVSVATTWTLNSAKTIATLTAVSLGTIHFDTWNGTVTLKLGDQLQAYAGQDCSGRANAGTVWANITYTTGGPPSTTSWSAVFNLQQSLGTSLFLAPSWNIPAGLYYSMGLSVAVTAAPSDSFNCVAPKGLYTVPIAGTGIDAIRSTPPGAANPVPFIWGWTWKPTTGSGPAALSGAATGYVTWTAPYRSNATYHSVTQTNALSGLFSMSSAATTISFASDLHASGSVPSTTFSYIVTYIVHLNATAPFLVTYNYTIGASTTSTFFSATESYPYNATYSVYVYSIPTPYGGISKITVEGNTTWTYYSSWPSGSTYYQANNTVYWHSPIPNATEVTFLAPTVYVPSTLTLVYVPASPVFSLFGASLPYSAVLTYVNGVFQPYSTFSVTVGSTYDVVTNDVFGNRLSDTNITVTQTPAQVAEITLNIWPMTVANMNSSYVIGFLLTENSVTQTAPDIMPLGSETFYLPAGTYTVTLNYLLLNTPAIAKTSTFPLTITGVSYDVVTGLSFLNIQTTTTMVGNNITNLVQTVNATLVDTNSSVNSLVQSIQNGLFSFHLNLGTAAVTKNVYSFPVFVTNGANGAVNGTVTQAVQQNLQTTYINASGSVSANAYVASPTVGNFQLFLAPTPLQVSEVKGGVGVFVLTSLVKVGALTVVAAGVVGAEALNSAVSQTIPVSPLNQQLLLNLYNTTRNSTSGVSTSTATWTNPDNYSFGGEVVLTGAWLGNARDVEVFVNGHAVDPNAMAVSSNEIIIFAGTVNLSAHETLTAQVTYLNVFQPSLTAPFALWGNLPVTPPLLLFLVAVVLMAGALLYEHFSDGKHEGLALALLMVILVGGGVVFY